MAITAFGSPLWIPNPPVFGSGGAPGFASSITINASGDKVAWVLQCPKAGTLDQFEVRCATFTQATNGIRLSFQTIDTATGFPDGTQDQYRDITSGLASNSWQAPPGAMTNTGAGGGVKRTVTQGEWIGCVVEFVSFAASDSVAFTPGWSQAAPDQLFNYIANAATGTYVLNDTHHIIALKYDDGTYAQFPLHATMPALTVNTRTFNSGSTPDEVGMRFTVPMSCRMLGGWVRLDLDGDADIILYDSVDAVQTTLAVVSKIRMATTGQNASFFLPTSITLTASSVYRLVVRPSSGTSLTTYDVTVNATALLGGIPGGSTWYRTVRTNAGAWTDNNVERPMMGLLLDGFDTTSGSGTGVSRGRVQRGM